MRTVFLGSSSFAVVVLSALAVSPHRPALVVTPPDRPQGRGRKTARRPPPWPRASSASRCCRPRASTIAEALAAIEAVAPEGIGVCEFGQLIREPLLSHDLMLNVHPSLLPRWRGAAPIERALMAGDTTTGVTIFQLTEGLDSGPMALQRAEPIHPDDTRGTLAARLARARRRASDRIVRSRRSRRPGADGAAGGRRDLRREDRTRPSAVSTRAGPRSSSSAWSAPSHPGIGAFIELEGGERLGVEAARAVARANWSPARYGSTDGRLLVGCAEGALELETVKPAGGRSMSAADYLRGHNPPPRVAV